MADTTNPPKWIKDAVKAIIADLSDRRGIGDEYEQCDAGVQREIKQTWAGIIVSYVPKSAD